MDKPLNIPLRQFQQWMQQLLLDPFQQTEVPPVSYLPDSIQEQSQDTTGIQNIIEATSKLDARRHLGIYQRGYIARLRNCMSQQFSALEYALGEDIFIAFADGYLASQPSTHYNLAELGRAFPSYMQATRPDATSEVKEDWIDFMIELAKFEFDFGVLYDQKGDEDFVPVSSEDTDADIVLRDVCGIFEYQIPIRWYYTEFKQDKNPALPHPFHSFCLVVRHNYQLYLYDLHLEQYAFLRLMKEGMNAAEAGEKFKRLRPGFADTFVAVWPEWRRRWMDVKLLRKK